MRFPYLSFAPDGSPSDQLPWLPIQLIANGRSLEVHGLVDSGATVNVLPFDVGIKLGLEWSPTANPLRLTGNLAGRVAMPAVVHCRIGTFPETKLVFAWSQDSSVPVILGQTNFFHEFDVLLQRSRAEFDISPHSTL